MSARCYWCDSDLFAKIYVDDKALKVDKKTGVIDDSAAEVKDYECSWCHHMASEPNPRIQLPLGVDRMKDWEGYEEWLLAKKKATREAREAAK